MGTRDSAPGAPGSTKRPGQRAGVLQTQLSRSLEFDTMAHYSVTDLNKVKSMLDHLRLVGLRIVDPETDFNGKDFFDSIYNYGIGKSRTSVVFVSKAFPSCSLETTQTKMAMYADIGNKHRVILVLLDSRKTPYYLRSALFVFAWKYEENKDRVHKKLAAAVRGNRFKPVVRKDSRDTSAGAESARHSLNFLKDSTGRIAWLCSNLNCPYICSIKRPVVYHRHVKKCRFKLLKCLDCQDLIRNKRFQRHKRKCLYRRVKCHKCDQFVVHKKFNGHKKKCMKPTNTGVQFECSFQIDKENRITKCKDCGQKLGQFENNHFCPYIPMQCPFCKCRVLSKDIDVHLSSCLKTVGQLKNSCITCHDCEEEVAAKDILNHFWYRHSGILAPHLRLEQPRRGREGCAADREEQRQEVTITSTNRRSIGESAIGGKRQEHDSDDVDSSKTLRGACQGIDTTDARRFCQCCGQMFPDVIICLKHEKECLALGTDDWVFPKQGSAISPSSSVTSADKGTDHANRCHETGDVKSQGTKQNVQGAQASETGGSSEVDSGSIEKKRGYSDSVLYVRDGSAAMPGSSNVAGRSSDELKSEIENALKDSTPEATGVNKTDAKERSQRTLFNRSTSSTFSKLLDYIRPRRSGSSSTQNNYQRSHSVGVMNRSHSNMSSSNDRANDPKIFAILLGRK